MPSAFTTSSSSVAIGLLQRKKDFFGDIWHFHTCYYKRQLGDKWSHDSKKYGIPHSVWKSQKKSLAIRAKQDTFAFWVDKRSLKMPKMINFGDFWKTWSLRPNSVTRQVTLFLDKNWWKMPKWKKIKCDIFRDFQTNFGPILARKFKMAPFNFQLR